MAEIMLPKIWIDGTAIPFLKRSTELKLVDKSITDYHNNKSAENFLSLATNFRNWLKTKGGEEASADLTARDHKKVVTLLKQQIETVERDQGPNRVIHVSPKGLKDAMLDVRTESQQIISRMFTDQKLEFKSLVDLSIVTGKVKSGDKTTVEIINPRDVGMAIKDIQTNSWMGSNVPAVPSSVPASTNGELGLSSRLIRGIAGEVYQDVQTAINDLMPNFIAGLVLEMVPFVGLAGSALQLIGNIGNVVKEEMALMSMEENITGTFVDGDPAKALTALLQQYTRRRNLAVSDLAEGLGKFGAKVATFFADLGVASNGVITLGFALLNMIKQIALITLDVRERNAINKLLATPPITNEIFNACPLAGAYFVCCVPTSVLVNVLFDAKNVGKMLDGNMQLMVDYSNDKHIGPLREAARLLIESHRMEFRRLRQTSPGLLLQNKAVIRQTMGNANV